MPIVTFPSMPKPKGTKVNKDVKKMYSGTAFIVISMFKGRNEKDDSFSLDNKMFL